MSSFTVCTSCHKHIREDQKGGFRGIDGGEEKCLLVFMGTTEQEIIVFIGPCVIVIVEE